MVSNYKGSHVFEFLSNSSGIPLDQVKKRNKLNINHILFQSCLINKAEFPHCASISLNNWTHFQVN